MKKSLMLCFSFAYLSLGCSSSEMGANSTLNYAYSSGFNCDTSCKIDVYASTVNSVVVISSGGNCSSYAGTHFNTFQCPAGQITLSADVKSGQNAKYHYTEFGAKYPEFGLVSCVVPNGWRGYGAAVEKGRGTPHPSEFLQLKTFGTGCAGYTSRNQTGSACHYQMVIEPKNTETRTSEYTKNADGTYSYKYSYRYDFDYHGNCYSTAN